MNDTNIGSEGSQRRYVVDSTIIYPLMTGVNYKYLDSSISASEQELVAHGIEANSPHLPLPTVSSFILSMENKTAAISLAVLESWGKSLEEQAARVKAELNSPAYLARQEAKLSTEQLEAKAPTTVTTSNKNDIGEVDLNLRHQRLLALGALVSVAIQLTQNVVSAPATEAAVNAVNVKNPATAIPSVAEVGGENISVGSQNIASQILSQGIALAAAEMIFFQAPIGLERNSGLHNEFKVFNDAWGAVTTRALDQDPAAQVAGWFSAMWGIGLIYQLSAEKVGAYGMDKVADKSIRDINFAKTYALRALNTIAAPAFSLGIQTMLLAAAEKSPGTSNAHFDSLMDKAKLVILSLALGLLAKLEVGSRKDEGWINELEFTGLIDGKTDIAKNDLFGTAGIKGALINEIKLLLAGLDPSERDEVIYRLSGYMSMNPAIEEMLDQQKAFDIVFNPPSFDEKQMLETPT